MITLVKLRDLTLSASSGPGRLPHVSAASGLVQAGPYLYVVGDDELHLGVFHAGHSHAGELIRLLPGRLPAKKGARKSAKPDFETLLRLPPLPGCPAGALLALGSGSKPNRRRGVLVALDAEGKANGKARRLDLSQVFTAMEDCIDGPNIEGGTVIGGELRLFQRGNKQDGRNALIRFALAPWLEALGAPRGIVGFVAPLDVHFVDLGTIDGIPLCFTDGAALPGGEMVFSAVAEATQDTYHDGACAGAAIGILDAQGRLRCLQRLEQPHKIEGIHATMAGEVIHLLLVSDADDAKIPAGLFAAALAPDQRGIVEAASTV